MYTTHTNTLSVGEKFLLSYLSAVLSYTKTDDDFAHSLKTAVLLKKWNVVDTSSKSPCSQHLLPTQQSDAIATAQWIIHSLQIHPEYQSARSTLAHWAQNYESPKDLVLGIVGLAIIGPTLGIISSKKKKKRKSQLVLEKNYHQTLSKKELAILTTELTQSVMAREIQRAGGTVYNLHPDSAAWCMEEALTQIYTDSATNLKELSAIVSTEHLSHHCVKDSTGVIQAMVISPSVNDSLVEESEAEKI